jgi:PAS domain S-box-containing protein
MTSITAHELTVILDSIHDGIIAVNRERTVILFNKAAERITGLNRQDMLGRSAAEVIPNTRLPIVLKQGEPELNQEQNIKKMLRVLQEKEIMKVGSTTTVPVDVRVIAATNANLEQKVRESRFREDLYYRLNVVSIPIPPLRSIREDIPLIARHVVVRLNQDYGRHNDSGSHG